MVQRRQHLGFTLERGVAPAVHLAHAALAEQREDFIVAEFVAYGKRQVW
jgi:hypothetical protein